MAMISGSVLSVLLLANLLVPGVAQSRADALSDAIASQLAGTYFFERTTPYGDEIRVVLVNGALRARLGQDERQLVLADRIVVPYDSGPQGGTRLYEFAIAGRPQESLQFEVSNQAVTRLNYLNKSGAPARVYTGRPVRVMRMIDQTVTPIESDSPSRMVTTRPETGRAEISRVDTMPAATPAYVLPRDIALLLIGSYGLNAPTSSGLRELHVSLVGGQPSLRLGNDEHLLLAQGATVDAYQFTVDRKPGLQVTFRIAGGQVSSLQYADRSAVPPVQLTGTPK